MSGIVFGEIQLIDLFIIVYSNEIDNAEKLRAEVEACAFSCTNSIKVSSDLPSFENPNIFEFDKGETEERFDTIYLLTKLANNFIWPDENKPEEVKVPGKLKQPPNTKQKRKPIFVADGLIAIDILNSLSRNMPSDVFFCPTPITAIGKSVLAEYLNVHCCDINEVHVWAANDEVFHLEVEKPLVIHDEVDGNSRCDPGMVGKEFLESLNLDPTQMNATWMKKDFVEKVASSASKNPYGCIYKAAIFAKTLRGIWKTRDKKAQISVACNMGVISNGSLGTAKGHPYVLPIIFKGDSWITNEVHFEESAHLKQELKRINAVVKKHHKKVTLLKLFLKGQIT
ncbi:unnamed protein product [Leptosia nina]|uniref:Malate dehydrogenase n=1 Tax=Leptosia nina TaxID=320188 RepID=A0AAV1J7T2_9NEOP